MDAHSLDVLEFARIRELLADRCRCAPARAVAAELVPENDEARIRLALRQTDEARAFLDAGAELPLTGISDIRAVIDAAHDSQRALEPGELLDLSRSLKAASDLRAFLNREPERAPALVELAGRLQNHESLLTSIDDAIETPGVVQDAASEKLWELRRSIRDGEEAVRDRLDGCLKNPRYRNALQSPTFSIRNGRFVVPVKVDMKGHVPGILHDQSQSGHTAFIEPSEIVPLTNELRELRLEQTKEENRILWELTRRVFASRAELVDTANVLAWFDFTAAKARLSRELDMRSAELSPDGRLRLVGARHPLLLTGEGAQDDVVPLDVRLLEGFRILVITGPNTGGKTVTLKTIGLLQLMFQSGLHVPADEGSYLPIFRDVFADIGDEQSIDQSLSTFSGHIKNITHILENAGRGTLVLLDELGAGTDPTEGAALGAAILETLREKRAASVVTTHLGTLKDFAFAHSDVENACVEFDARSMQPTYRLLIGQPGNSNALLIARRYGLDEDVLKRAEEKVASEQGEHTEVIDKLMESRVAVERTRQESERRLQKSKNLQKAAEERMRHVEKRQRRVEREAEDLIDETLKKLVTEADRPLRELKNVPAALKPAASKLEDLLRDSIKNTSIGERRRELIATLKKEDQVFVPKFGKLVRIRKFHRADEQITVVVGNMTMKIDYDDVSWIQPLPDADEN